MVVAVVDVVVEAFVVFVAVDLVVVAIVNIIKAVAIVVDDAVWVGLVFIVAIVASYTSQPFLILWTPCLNL